MNLHRSCIIYPLRTWMPTMHCLVIEDKFLWKSLKKNKNKFMLLMMLASHISFGYCCCHYKLGSTVVTWQEGSNPKLTGQGLSLWSSGSGRSGFLQTVNDLGWGRGQGVAVAQDRPIRSHLATPLHNLCKEWTWTPSSAATGQRCVSYSHPCVND